MDKHQMRILLLVLGLLVLLQIGIYRNPTRKYSAQPTDLDVRSRLAQLFLTNSPINMCQNVFAAPNNSSPTLDNLLKGSSFVSKDDLSRVITQLRALKRSISDNDGGELTTDIQFETTSTYLQMSTGVKDWVKPVALPVETNNISHYSISNPKHWIPDWENQTDLYQVLVNRRKTVDDRCESLQPYSYPLKGQRASPLIVGSRFVRLCTTAKGGSSFWKTFLKTQHSIEKNQKPAGNETTVKFVVSRNPWHRLVSAWSDKFNMGGGWSKYWMRAMCAGKTWESCPPFNFFVSECVLKLWRKHRWNNHWAPAIDRCQICDINAPRRFDYIVSAENMNEEAVAMFEHENTGIPNIREQITGSREKAMRPSERQHVTASYQYHYQNVSASDIAELRQIYATEIYLFGYPDTPFVDFERS